jgi:predicted nucleic acid-binding protein
VIHLDSAFVIDLQREMARARPDGALDWIESIDPQETLAISVHVACELRAGVELARQPLRELEILDEVIGGLLIVYPDDRFAPLYGRLLASIQRAGRHPVATMDLLIATAALLDDAPLVTRNARDFTRIPGLRTISY